ncbi:MAG TPA: methylmalonyl-CoA mutase family protein, partial [Thermoplasmata archaeon]|nr:methylmalonyl-CoA mutase family protein [Thermoplasmata archaeon]
NALDEALGLPTEASARLALRTQQILAEESGVASTVDPLGGAYAIEELTDRIEEGAEEYLGRVEEMGGALVAVEKGFFTAEIAKEAYRNALALEKKAEIVVGVNDFTEGNPRFSLFPGEVADARTSARRIREREDRQIARLRRWKKERDARRVVAALEKLERVTRAGSNVMPSVLEAVRAGATLGEVAEVWRGTFGEYRPPRAF